jgi:UV DNA damage endonuclease
MENEKFSPKIHVSSPKSESNLKSHHDYINAEEFVKFLHQIKGKVSDFDAMLEAKKKDLAVFKLIEDIEKIEFIKKVGDATIDI